jgi:hypothetical protein
MSEVERTPAGLQMINRLPLLGQPYRSPTDFTI